MDFTIQEYLEDLKRHLKPDDNIPLASYWDYDFEYLLEYKEYFQKCLDKGLSTYKALFFFEDYKNGEYNI